MKKKTLLNIGINSMKIKPIEMSLLLQNLHTKLYLIIKLVKFWILAVVMEEMLFFLTKKVLTLWAWIFQKK